MSNGHFIIKLTISNLKTIFHFSNFVFCYFKLLFLWVFFYYFILVLVILFIIEVKLRTFCQLAEIKLKVTIFLYYFIAF